MTVKTKYWISFGVLLLGILLLLISIVVPENIAPYVGTPGLLIALGALISRFFFWKCPSCETFLPLNGSLGLEYCPYCGEGIG